MDIMQMGTELLSSSLGGSAESAQLSDALSGLLGGGDGGIDLGAIATKMASSGELSSALSSWLGDGANTGISADSINSLLGDADIASFANKLGIDPSVAASSLAEMLPQLMDKSSSGGSLLESLGGADGLLSAAKSFLS
ncbi:MAG: DUF937 domain-containing protein [Proteobacteria bacterium]|nr:DUF937 domain-containing protein [Pseudomonadota bacterium]